MTEDSKKQEWDDAESRIYLRQNVMKALVFLGVLIVVSILTGFYFETQIMSVSKRFVEGTGRFGLIGLTFLTDLIISPLPPDIFLLMLSKSPHDLSLLLTVTMLGCASSLAGTCAWFLGRKANPAWFGSRFSKFLKESHGRINRYGKWIVALGALTPLPFSLTCWAAGIFKMDFAKFFPMALLRIPRFLLYFYILLASGTFSRWLRDISF